MLILNFFNPKWNQSFSWKAINPCSLPTSVQQNSASPYMLITAPNRSRLSFILRYHCLFASLSPYIVFFSFHNFFVLLLSVAALFISSIFIVHLFEQQWRLPTSGSFSGMQESLFSYSLGSLLRRLLLPLLLPFFQILFFMFSKLPKSSVSRLVLLLWFLRTLRVVSGFQTLQSLPQVCPACRHFFLIQLDQNVFVLLFGFLIASLCYQRLERSFSVAAFALSR